MASASSPVTRQTNFETSVGSNGHSESHGAIHQFEKIAQRTAEYFPSLELERDGALLGATPQSSTGPQFSKRPARFAVKTRQRIVFLNATDITAVEARGNYIVLRHKSSPMVVRESLSNVAEKLKPYGLLRIHRSYLVNMAFVAELKALSTGEYLLRLTEGKEYIVSRSYKKNLRLMADLWIGVRGPAS